MLKIVFIAALAYAVWLIVRPKRKRTALPGEAEARDILGVSATADEDEIRAAHRRLVNGVHPDKGGSAELTRRINAARDVLLRRS